MIFLHNFPFQRNLLGTRVCHFKTDNSDAVWFFSFFYFVLGLFKGFSTQNIYKITN